MHKLFPLLLVMLLLSGCGGIIDRYFLPAPEDTVQEIFEAGNDAMQEKAYGKAAKYFADIKDNYPFSAYVTEAELSYADALFLNEKYLEAADAYKEFEELHPRHEAVPYALFQVGKSLRLSYTSVDRSSADLQTGLDYLKRLEAEYPNTDYADKAAVEIPLIRENMAKRDVYIADIYLSMNNYEAAYNRYRYVMETYPDVPTVYAYAETNGKAAFLKFRNNSSEAVREAREGTWKNLFRWL